MLQKLIINKPSISRDYFLFALITIFAIIVLSVILSLIIRDSQEINKNHLSSFESKRISNTIASEFDYTNKINTYIGRQITEKENPTVQDIYDIFKEISVAQYRSLEIFSWSLFDWVAPNNLQLVNSKNGIAKNPPDMSHREYTRLSPIYPWTLQLSPPTIGIPSGKWVIPAGTGITKKNGEYLGTVVVGLNIAAISMRIEDLIANNNVNFMVLDKNYNIVMKSSSNPIDPKSIFYKDLLTKKDSFLDNEGELKNNITQNNIVFSHYKKLENYPYIVLTGFDKSFLDKEFATSILPRILEFSIIGGFFLILLYFFRRNIISPISDLSNAADKIANGEEVKKVPRGSTYETTNLAYQILKVKKSLQQEKRYKNEIEKAKDIAEKSVKEARESKKAKEEFLLKISNELKKPLENILLMTEVFKNEHFGKLDKRYVNAVDSVQSQVLQMYTAARNILNLSLIKPAEIIEEAIKIHKDMANIQKVSIKSSVPKKLPEIYVDEIRFRQIIVGTLFHSLSMTPENETVEVQAEKLEGKEKQYLVITITDTGFGISEDTREEIFNRYKDHALSISFDGTDLSISDIRKMVALHKGTLEISSTHRQGTVFKIEIPYLDKDKLNTPSKPDDGKVTPLFGKKQQ